MSLVSGSKFQNRITNIHQEALSPGTGTTHSTTGVLLEVYDQEKLEQIVPTQALAARLARSPGLLFAKVLLTNGKTYVLPFDDAEDFIYLTYGNAFLLEGRTVRVSWKGMSIENGVLDIARTWGEKHINIPVSFTSYDVGHIV